MLILYTLSHSAGRFRTPAQLEERERTEGTKVRGGQPSPTEARIAEVLDKMGREDFNGASIAQMALAYVFNKTPHVFPIVGGTKISHLEDNIKAIEIVLSQEQIAKIEEASSDFDLGFPLGMIGADPHETGSATFPLVTHAGYIDLVKHPRSAAAGKN